MAKRWTFKECKSLKAIVEAKADSLYTKRGQPRKTFPEEFWEAVSRDMEHAGFRGRSASSVRKKFKSLGYEIQGSLNYSTESSTVGEPIAKTANILSYIGVEGEPAGRAHVLFIDELFSGKGVPVRVFGSREEVFIRCEFIEKTESGRGLMKISALSETVARRYHGETVRTQPAASTMS